MADFALIHGGGESAGHWSAVAGELVALGHHAVPVDLPTDDPAADLSDWADVAADAIRGAADPVVVAHSLGGFTGPLVCTRLPVRLLVLVAAMIPVPGESVSQWWTATGHRVLDESDSIEQQFAHDVPAAETEKDVADTAMNRPWPASAWPAVPTQVLACRDDRFFPLAFQRRVTRERLGLIPDEIDGSHSVHLSRPAALAARLASYWDERGRAPVPPVAG